MIISIRSTTPKIDRSAFLAPTATIVGNVSIGERSGVWFGSIVRGDSNTISIGNRTNVQDLCVLHVDDKNPMTVGDDVSIGHRAILHGCHICDRVLIGMGAIVMNGAKVGEDSIVAAGALVTEKTQVPPRSLIMGMPAKVKRELADEEVASIRRNAQVYVNNIEIYKKRE